MQRMLSSLLIQASNWLRPILLSGLVLLVTTFPSHAANDDKLVISGASGQLGELVVKELLKRGVPARNLILVSRSPDKLAEFAAQGASVRFGDLTQPESLPAAYAGGTRMLLISITPAPGLSRPEAHKRGFDAAVKAGIKHVVYTSFMGADKGDTPLAADHQQSENFLKASGAKWTMLRNGLYADRIVEQAANMLKAGKVTIKANEPKTAPVTREDCAAAAAGALLDARFENQAYDITGPAAINTADIASAASAITGKRIAIEISDQASGLGGGISTPPTISRAVEELAGRPATSLRALLEANKATLLAAAR